MRKYLGTIVLVAAIGLMGFSSLFVSLAQNPSTTSSELVHLTVTVVDENGNYHAQFAQQDFQLGSNKTTPTVISWTKDQHTPVSVVILIDRSALHPWVANTTNHNPLSALPKALSQFLQWLPENSEYSIVSSRETPDLLFDWHSVKDDIVTKLTPLATEKPKGSGGLYDACQLAMEQARKGRHSKRIVLLFGQSPKETDKSRTRPREVKKILKTSDVLVYIINLGPEEYVSLTGGGGAFHSEEYVEPGFFKDLAKISGGKLFHPTSYAGLKWALETLSKELRCQYTFGISFPNKVDDRWKFKVDLKPTTTVPPTSAKLLVRYREEYSTAVQTR
jgi:VWFA-related protein